MKKPVKFRNVVAEYTHIFSASVSTVSLGKNEFCFETFSQNKIFHVEIIYTVVIAGDIFICNLRTPQVSERRPGDHAQRITKRLSTMIRKSTFAATIAKLFGTAAVAATVFAAPAQAGVKGVLDFEGYADNIVFDGFGVVMGDYYLEAAGGGYGLIGNNASCTRS